MRLLVFTLEFPPRLGGVQTMAYQLTKHLSQTGVQVEVLTLEMNGADEFDSKQDFAIQRTSLGASETWIGKLDQKIHLRQDLNHAIENAKPECILCIHWDPCAYLTRSVTKGIPYFVVAHGMELMQLPKHGISLWAKSWLRYFALQGARKIFAVSNFTRAKVLALGIAPERVHVIPNGVELDNSIFDSNENQFKHAPHILLTVSRLVPRKGHDVVLRALPQVIRKIPDVVYWIAGVGPERKNLERLTRELKLEKQVKFYGEVSETEKERLLKECDLFVLPCRENPTDFEGFGLAFLEAMRWGKPVIGGRSGGVPDVIHDQENGLLVKPDDPADLARAILKILESPADAQCLGKNGWLAVRERYRWDSIASKYLMGLSAR